MEEINNTPMNEPETNKWLSDLEMDEYNLFPEECNLNFLDADEKQEFVSHDIATVFQEQNQHQHVTSECTSTTLTNLLTDETSFESFDFGFELTIIDQNDNITTETISPKLSPTSSISSFQSQILSFENLPNSPATNTPQFFEFDHTLNSKQNETVSVSPPQLENTHVFTQTRKGSSKNQNLEAKTSQPKRSRANAEDHIMAERKRREILSQSFIALAALIPNLKKMDKASVLAESIKYVKELKDRLEVLEDQNKKTKAESAVVLNKPDICSDEDNSSSDESIECGGGGDSESLLQVEARELGKEMLIRIHCKKKKGVLVKMMGEIQSLELFVVNSNVLPFGDSVLDITIIAQIGEGYNLSIKELVKKLRMDALKFMSS
ncbi:transcription factor bHLH18-like [Vicia villosa]|uniref:transcription factor bHLH18-like n=1 Tax=Vicia villosa TaxID=3911 RepID=UPI00273CA987|nr:transcription factor bHLH18-like [Vicia villosa]